jgi:spermine/spermidine synthase
VRLPARSPSTLLVVASALLLFVELALIRWLGANIVHLSYFSNFVLLGSFLGGGIGFLRARSARSATWLSPVVLAALVWFVLAFPVQIDQKSSQVIYFTAVTTTGFPAYVTLPIVFVAVAAIIAGIGEVVGRQFLVVPTLTAYRLDLLGSLAGVALFTGLAFARAPSVVWGAISAVGFLFLVGRRLVVPAMVASVVIVVLLAGESLKTGVSWSPYYKVSTETVYDGSVPVTRVSVNGVPHQEIESVEPRLRREPIYGYPYLRLPHLPLDHVLIVGAGTGTDVEVALHEGAKDIDAVEIDPRLHDLGVELNPDRPYSDPRVHVHINDGRAYLQQTDKRYDLILFALPDSLTLVPGASSIRLESYLFTKQAIALARSHLLPGGAFAMYNFYREQWLVNRYAGTLRDVFAHPPCIDTFGTSGHEAVLVDSVQPNVQVCDHVWSASRAATPAPVSDDRPFPYLRTAGIPRLYLFALGAILLAALLSVLPWLPSRRSARSYADLFFMGSAFLLLETKNVTGFALFFGTTWFVNALVFGGVLLAVLAAVETARRIPRVPLAPVYAVLLAALAAAWLVHASWLLGLGFWPRLAMSILLAFAPIFLANLAFAERLRAVEEPTVAFGMNLLGAMVGGCVEYVSLLIGYRALLIVVAGLYAAAFLLAPHRRARLANTLGA